jgi:hypothetical protein
MSAFEIKYGKKAVDVIDDKIINVEDLSETAPEEVPFKFLSC